MGGAMSRRKGAAGERECAAVFSDNGFPDAHRMAPMQAGQMDRGYADLGGTGFLHVEVKRGEREALAARAAELVSVERPGYESVLASRRNRGPWLGTMALERLAVCMAELTRLRAIEARLKVAWPGVHAALTEPLPLVHELDWEPISATPGAATTADGPATPPTSKPKDDQ
jgi:hypothetical protein